MAGNSIIQNATSCTFEQLELVVNLLFQQKNGGKIQSFSFMKFLFVLLLFHLTVATLVTPQ